MPVVAGCPDQNNAIFWFIPYKLMTFIEGMELTLTGQMAGYRELRSVISYKPHISSNLSGLESLPNASFVDIICNLSESAEPAVLANEPGYFDTPCFKYSYFLAQV